LIFAENGYKLNKKFFKEPLFVWQKAEMKRGILKGNRLGFIYLSSCLTILYPPTNNATTEAIYNKTIRVMYKAVLSFPQIPNDWATNEC
jgi:hypothetical protein